MTNPKNTRFRITNRILLFCFVLFFLSQLTGCGTFSGRQETYAEGDYAPNFQIDVSKIPDAVPIVEPLSKYGNPPSYVACGHRYYVMKSAQGYDEKGIASWYGMKFYKARTSSGEPYNVAAMTAAHKTLPLPTYVLVTNLKNGKHVVVKVNDRGPFVANRLIDLSYAAAVKLSVTAHGTALVEVKAIDPRHPERVLKEATLPPSITSQKQPHLYLQMGAFSQRSNAERLAEQVRQCTTLPVLIKTVDRNGQPIYRVQIGPVPGVEYSDELYERLKAAGLGRPIVVVQ